MARERVHPKTGPAQPEHRSAAPTPLARSALGAAGNLAVGRALTARSMRAKLDVSQPGDPVEEEADRAADRVMRMPAPATGEETSLPCGKAASQPEGAPSLSGGQPLPASERAFFEPRFGRDFSDVSIHTDSHAAGMAQSINAKAFTVANKIAFAPGQFQQQNTGGRELLAHELAHVVQGNDASSASVKREPDAGAGSGSANTANAGATNAGAAGAGQQGAPPGQPPVAATLDKASQDSLTKSGLLVSAAEASELAQGFPGGFTVGPPTPAVLSLDFGNRLDGVRVEVFKLTAARVPQAGVEAFFFQVGKGRSILVSSVGGGSVLLDVGSGQTSSANAQSVQRLDAAIGAVTAGPAEVPLTIKVSHADTDHYNTLRTVMTRAAFGNTTVEVARQQIDGAGAWTRSSLTVQPTQRLIEVDVTGTAGVHIQRTVIDNMELTEYRSVAAHDDLTRTDKVTFNRNRTSPVVVVRDLNTGSRMLFTADAEGRQFDEIVNAVGDTGMRRLLGAEGRNLKVMEAPHHFGEQAGPNARGMINMLQLAYESGDGSLRLVAQTTQNFATKASSTYNFLDASGTAPERVENDPSGAGRAQVTRAQGSTLAQVTVDMTGVQTAIQELQARDTPLRDAYSRLAELDAMQSRLEGMRAGLGGTAATPITASLTTSEADVARLRADLSAATQAVWDAMRAAAAPEGMRNTVDMTAVGAALAQVAARVAATGADATRVGEGILALAEGLNTYSKLSINSVRIINALETDNVTELYAARAEHNDLVRAARADLGNSAVDEHIRTAWKAVQAEWPVEQFEARTAEMSARVAARERNAEFRAVLAEGLARQYELNEVVARAEHAGRQVYDAQGNAVTPMSTRVGAGVMAAIEVVRIGLDLYGQWKAGSDAAEQRQARTAYQGIAIMNWWQRLGVTPNLALAKQGIWDQSELYVVMRDPQDKVREAAMSDTPLKDVPEFTAVVVNGLDQDGLRKLVHRAVAEIYTLEDWNVFNTSFPGGAAFRVFNGFVWGVRVFHEDSAKYSYVPVDEIAPGLNLEMIQLYGALLKAQEDAFEIDKKEGKAAYGVKDTAWVFGQDRRVMIYSRGGSPQEIDFDSDRPRFQKLATVTNPWRIRGTMVKVKAADVMTYTTLVDYFWAEANGQQNMGPDGMHESADIGPNVHGFAYVEPEHLIERGD